MMGIIKTAPIAPIHRNLSVKKTQFIQRILFFTSSGISDEFS